VLEENAMRHGSNTSPDRRLPTETGRPDENVVRFVPKRRAEQEHIRETPDRPDGDGSDPGPSAA
jgi:hypothetical protein